MGMGGVFGRGQRRRQEVEVRVEDPIGFPEFPGWRVTAVAGPVGVAATLQELVEPPDIGEARFVYFFSGWDELRETEDVRRALRRAVAGALDSMGELGEDG